jgi:hypothetical protein
MKSQKKKVYEKRTGKMRVGGTLLNEDIGGEIEGKVCEKIKQEYCIAGLIDCWTENTKLRKFR